MSDSTRVTVQNVPSASVRVVEDRTTVSIPSDRVSVVTVGTAGPPGLDGAGFRMIDARDYVDITGVTDGTAGMQAAFNAAASAAGVIYLPHGSIVKVTDTLTIPDGLRTKFRLIGDGPVGAKIDASALGGKALFKADPSATPATATRRQYWSIEGVWIAGPGSGVAGSIGIHLNNALDGELRRVYVSGFETGVLLDGLDLVNGAACYYNDFYKLIVASCGVGLKMTGQANSNVVHGGKIINNGVGWQVDDNCTANDLIGVDVESSTTYGVRIDGYGNSMLGGRLENPSATYEVAFNVINGAGTNDGAHNRLMPYFTSNDLDTKISDASVAKDNLIIWAGQIWIGSPGTTRKPVLKSFRYSDANLMPMVEMEDRYTSGGSPIGFRHTTARVGGIGLELCRTVSPFTTKRTYLRGMVATTGEAQLWWGDYNADAIDTLLERTAADRLSMGAGDYFRTGSVAALPTASSAYRGYTIRVEGGTGVADKTYQCLKTAADTYTWVQIATG